MASGRINRNVLIYISGGSGCTPSEANTLVPTPVLTTAWVRGLTSDSILTADRRGGILIHEHEAPMASRSKRVTQATWWRWGVVPGARPGATFASYPMGGEYINRRFRGRRGPAPHRICVTYTLGSESGVRAAETLPGPVAGSLYWRYLTCRVPPKRDSSTPPDWRGAVQSTAGDGERLREKMLQFGQNGGVGDRSDGWVTVVRFGGSDESRAEFRVSENPVGF